MEAEEAVLGYLENNDKILDSRLFAEEKGISHDKIVNVIKSLKGFSFIEAQVSFISKLNISQFN